MQIFPRVASNIIASFDQRYRLDLTLPEKARKLFRLAELSGEKSRGKKARVADCVREKCNFHISCRASGCDR